MKKSFLIGSACLFFTAAWALGGPTLTFNDGVGTANAGSYAPGSTFFFDITLTLDNTQPDANGLSYWFLARTQGTAPTPTNFFNITAEALGTGSGGSLQASPFTDANSIITFPEVVGTDTQGNADDLGATTSSGAVAAPGTYPVSRLSFSVSGAATPGVYLLQTTTAAPHQSEVGDSTFTQNNLPPITYTVTVVPEPSTTALVIVALLGAGIWTFRSRRKFS